MATGTAQRDSHANPSSKSNESTTFCKALETITAKPARAARWSLRSFAIHPSLQFFVRLDSDSMVPHCAPEVLIIVCTIDSVRSGEYYSYRV
jgi:hypothetical protein